MTIIIKMMLRQLLKSSRPAQRSFSSLLVPIEQAASAAPVAELQSTPLTDSHFEGLREVHAQYNAACADELQEMNRNVIDNIVSRGGDAGWEQAANFDSLKKQFDFPSFEQADAFIQAVGVRANALDHHPEWRLTNAGCTVDVTLTSHFAGNKVTRLDFELAEVCNEEFTKNVSTFKMFPRFDDKQWASLKIALGAFCLGVWAFRIATGPDHPVRRQHYASNRNIAPFQFYDHQDKVLSSHVPALVEENLDSIAIRHTVDRPIVL